jgi:hypothetical protein
VAKDYFGAHRKMKNGRSADPTIFWSGPSAATVSGLGMATLTLLLGRTRDRRRRALRVERWSGTDRLGRPNFLFITDSARKKVVVQEEFVQYRQGASFLPEVATLSEIEARLAGR